MVLLEIVLHTRALSRGTEFVVRIVRAEHVCLRGIVRTHTCVLQKQRLRGPATACGDSLMLRDAWRRGADL